MLSNATASSYDSLEQFSEVIAAINLSQIPHEANRLRWGLGADSSSHNLPILETPLHGSYNILYPVRFADDLKWLIRIPAHGTTTKWDSLCLEVMTSEVMTMKMIKNHTSIPVPDIHGFSATLDNALGCPYIFMSFIPGIPLYDVWFKPNASNAELARIRTRALEQIVAAMVQLDKFSSQLGGRITFNQHGKLTGVGPYHETHDEQRFQAGPFTDPKEFYTCVMDRYPYAPTGNETPRTISLLRGEEILLRMFVDCIMQLENPQDFVLTHPDFGFQNFLVSSEGDLLGIIDWDKVIASPRSLGNKRYPSWLTRDWDPVMYGYEDGQLLPGVEREDSPASLKHYRKVYRDLVTSSCQNQELGFETSATLITENIEIACKESGLRASILTKIIEEISLVVELPKDISAFEIALDLGDGLLEESERDTSCRGFGILLRTRTL